MHRSMKAGVKKSGWNVSKVMKAIWEILGECTGDLYESITESNLYPVPLWTYDGARMINVQTERKLYGLD